MPSVAVGEGDVTSMSNFDHQNMNESLFMYFLFQVFISVKLAHCETQLDLIHGAANIYYVIENVHPTHVKFQ